MPNPTDARSREALLVVARAIDPLAFESLADLAGDAISEREEEILARFSGQRQARAVERAEAIFAALEAAGFAVLEQRPDD